MGIQAARHIDFRTEEWQTNVLKVFICEILYPMLSSSPVSLFREQLGPSIEWTEACAHTPFDDLTTIPIDVVEKWAGPFSFNQRVLRAKVAVSDRLSLIFVPVWKAASTEESWIAFKKNRYEYKKVL